jgi:predicted nucleotidyltransferase
MADITPKEAEKLALQYIEVLRERLGDNLKMAALYGSLIREDFKPSTSDINVIVITSCLDFEVLKTISSIVSKAKTISRISTLLLCENEVKRMAELFPIKFFEIKKHYRLITGEDFIKDNREEWSFFRERARQELLNIELRLRKALILGYPSPTFMRKPLMVFIPHLLSLLRILVDMPESKQFDEDDTFLNALVDKRNTIENADLAELETTYQLIFSHIDSVMNAVEKL